MSDLGGSVEALGGLISQEVMDVQQDLTAVRLDEVLDEVGPMGGATSERTIGSDTDINSGHLVANSTLVVRRLLQFMGDEDLLKCRLVSSLWNDEVVRLLTDTSENSPVYNRCIEYLKGLIPHLNRLAEKPREEKSKGKKKEKTLRQFEILLKKSKHPELLISILHISKQIPKECKHFLGKFGQFVRNLVIEDDDNKFSVFTSCLGQKGHCPNVHNLHLTASKFSNEELSSVEKFPTLKLKRVTIHFNRKSVSGANPTTGLFKVFHGILKNSPQIEELAIESCPALRPSYCNTHRFIQILQSNPEATLNLKAFWLEGNILENFHRLPLLKFGPNLKSIYLHENWNDSKEFKTEEEELRQKVGFGRFLKSVSQSLESLNVEFYPEDCLRVKDIPLMPKLKEFSFQGPPELSSRRRFFRKFPSLTTFSMSGITSFNGLLKGPGSRGNREVLKRLESISLEDRTVSNPGTIENLNVAFPNLSRLEIELNLPEGFSLEECQVWVEQCFLLISKMNCLKYLKIELDDWKWAEWSLDWNKVFLNLKETPRLNCVEVILRVLVESKVNSLASSLSSLTLLGQIKWTFSTEVVDDVDMKRKFELSSLERPVCHYLGHK